MKKQVIAQDNSLKIIKDIEIECFRCNQTFRFLKPNYISPNCYKCKCRNYFYISKPKLMSMVFGFLGIESNGELKQKVKKMQRKNMKLIDETKHKIEKYISETDIETLTGIYSDCKIYEIMDEEIGCKIGNTYFLKMFKEKKFDKMENGTIDSEIEEKIMGKKRFKEYIDL